MKSSYLRNSVLLLLIVGLYWFINQSDTALNNTEQPITELNSSEIQLITISRAHSDDITLEKIASGWQISHPIKARANETRIALLLSLLNSYSYGQLSDIGNNILDQFGLAPAKVSLKLDDYLFQFGDIETISKHRYVLHNGTIHLIDDQAIPLLNANVMSFIDNRLVPPSNIIDKLELPILNTDKTLSNNTVIIENIEGLWQSNHQIKQQTAVDLAILADVWQQAYALQVQPINTDTIISSHQIKIWYQNQDIPSKLELQLTDYALFITDHSQQLTYQFPVTLTQQLLPITIEVEP